MFHPFRRWRTAGAAAPAVLLAVLIGCRPDPAPPPPSEPPAAPEKPDRSDGPARFEDVTARVGLKFVHAPGRTGPGATARRAANP